MSPSILAGVTFLGVERAASRTQRGTTPSLRQRMQDAVIFLLV